MKRIALIIIIATACLATKASAQEIITSDGVNSIDTEWVDGNQWGILTADSIVVTINAQEVSQYGHYYRIGLTITNMRSTPITFCPDSVSATLTTVTSESKPLTILSRDQYKSKVSNDRFWSGVIDDISQTLFTPWVEDYAPGTTALTQYARDRDTQRIMEMVNGGYLLKNTIRPGKTLAGFLNVKYEKKGSSLEVALNIDGCTFKAAWWVYK